MNPIRIPARLFVARTEAQLARLRRAKIGRNSYSPLTPGLVSAMEKRGEQRKGVPQKGRSPCFGEEETAALFWSRQRREWPFARVREKFAETHKIMKILRLFPPTNWEKMRI